MPEQRASGELQYEGTWYYNCHAGRESLLHGGVHADVRGFRQGRPTRTEGKSGGVRVIYYFVDREELVLLFLVYPKSQKDDLTPAEENAVKKIAKALKGEA